MYKVVYTYQLLPGKYAAFKAYVEKLDEERRKAVPDFVPPKRWVALYGSTHRVAIEFEVDKLDMQPMPYVEETEEELESEGISLVVPGSHEMWVWQEVDLSS